MEVYTHKAPPAHLEASTTASTVPTMTATVAEILQLPEEAKTEIERQVDELVRSGRLSREDIEAGTERATLAVRDRLAHVRDQWQARRPAELPTTPPAMVPAVAPVLGAAFAPEV